MGGQWIRAVSPLVRKREQEVARQDAIAIARRFMECMHQDTFPEMGDLHLFGIGGEYQARSQEVLAVWQGAVKNEDISEGQLADALQQGRMKEFLKETCHALAKSKTPNSTYAKLLIQANFAGVEWDDL